MLVWGTGGNAKTIGNSEYKTCETCNQANEFQYLVQYRYFHIWYLFSFLTSRKYFEVCSHCGASHEVTKKQVLQKQTKIPIPFVRKNGWLICLVLVGAFMGYGHYLSSANQATMSQYFAQPQLNDVYLANLTQVESSGYDKDESYYGLMKIVDIDDKTGDFFFIFSTYAYERKKDLSKNLYKLEFDKNDVIAFTAAEIADYRQQGIIYEVQRNGQ